jgi:D-beta-D-heptose 7-phosphate kinase/D-beta-D-heptose 1-phosphate adenosyltransferase
MIETDIVALKSQALATLANSRIVMTSGGFDPLHVGHLRCIIESALIARDSDCKLVVVVNGDGFLNRKKGYAFMPLDERMEIINGISGVDYVTTWDDGTQFVTGAVEILRPSIFTKGGDRTDRTNIPEFEICDKIGCRVLTGVGGGKIQSSSDLVRRLHENR